MRPARVLGSPSSVLGRASCNGLAASLARAAIDNYMPVALGRYAGACQFAYRPDLGVVLNATQVADWSDYSGNARTASALGAAQPTYSASGGPRNKPYVNGDGTDDVLSTASFAVAQPVVVYVLFKMDAAYAGEGDGRTIVGDAGSVNQVRFCRRVATNSISLASNSFIDATYNDATAWNYSRVIANGASSELRENTTVRVTGNAGALGLSTGLSMFKAFGANSSDCSIADVLGYSALPNATFDAMLQAYYKNGYAIKAP